MTIKRESDHLVDFYSYLNALDNPNGMLIGNLGIHPFNPKKYLYHAYVDIYCWYIRNIGLSNHLILLQFGKSLNYAMNENGKQYMKKRFSVGVKTNLELNLSTSEDWLPKAEDPS